MENKKETTDFFLTSFSNYAALEDAYIYMKLGNALGLGIRITEASSNPTGIIFKSNYENDCTLRITLSGSQEYMDKFSMLWNKIDRDAIKVDLNRCLSIGSHETI